MLSRKTFAAGMALLASVYEKLERITTDKFLSEQWYKMLYDLSDEQFKKAVEIVIKTRKFSPTIADIREAAALNEQIGDYSPEEAWAIVYNDIHKKGNYNEPHYDDWKLEAAKNAIGWQTLCDMPPDEKNIIRAHFMRIYESLSNRERSAIQTKDPRINQLVSSLAGRLAPSSNKPELSTKVRLQKEIRKTVSLLMKNKEDELIC